uniref:Crumbs homolog 3a n=1 Tax=Gadus morhua TaxID=8049 RepID=A0A8C5F623_GADMO
VSIPRPILLLLFILPLFLSQVVTVYVFNGTLFFNFCCVPFSLFLQELDILPIVLPIVVLGALAIALAVVFWLLCVVKKKRQTEGTYRPSAEEQSGSHGVEMPDALKLPKEERLI